MKIFFIHETSTDICHVCELSPWRKSVFELFLLMFRHNQYMRQRSQTIRYLTSSIWASDTFCDCLNERRRIELLMFDCRILTKINTSLIWESEFVLPLNTNVFMSRGRTWLLKRILTRICQIDCDSFHFRNAHNYFPFKFYVPLIQGRRCWKFSLSADVSRYSIIGTLRRFESARTFYFREMIKFFFLSRKFQTHIFHSIKYLRNLIPPQKYKISTHWLIHS